MSGSSGYNLVTKPTQENWLSSMGITADDYNKYSNDEKLAINDAFTKTYGVTNTPGVNPLIEYSNAESVIPGLTNGGLASIGQVAGIGGTLLNTYDNLWGNKADLFKAQKAALNQNMANVAADRANHQAFVSNFGGGVNSAFKSGSGLAASGATVKL